MAAPVENTTRAALVWAGVAAVVIAGFFVTVAILNATVYSAPGFVRGYLDALDRGDTASALAFADVTPGADDVLLTVSEKGRIDDVRIASDLPAPRGGRVVAATFTADGTERRVSFAVTRDGVFGGLFSRWTFQTPPTASLEITSSHDARFTANGADIRAKSADLAARYTVLAPAVFELSHDTTYLTATPVTSVAASPGTVSKATVVVVPKDGFVSKVRRDVTSYLRTTCLPQRVLLPSGCPFGQQVDDRLTGEPTWTMTAYPAVSLRPTATPGVWLVAEAAGKAHLKVGAQSLYDGHAYTIDEAVPFDVQYLVTIGSDNRLTITPR